MTDGKIESRVLYLEDLSRRIDAVRASFGLIIAAVSFVVFGLVRVFFDGMTWAGLTQAEAHQAGRLFNPTPSVWEVFLAAVFVVCALASALSALLVVVAVVQGLRPEHRAVRQADAGPREKPSHELIRAQAEQSAGSNLAFTPKEIEDWAENKAREEAHRDPPFDILPTDMQHKIVAQLADRFLDALRRQDMDLMIEARLIELVETAKSQETALRRLIVSLSALFGAAAAAGVAATFGPAGEPWAMAMILTVAPLMALACWYRLGPYRPTIPRSGGSG